MKKRIIILIITFVLSTTISVNAQADKTSDTSLSTSITNVIENLDIDFSERLITISVVIAELVILFFVLFYWKKTKDDVKTDDNLIFKNNIKAIRNERIKPINNAKKSRKRKKIKADLKLNSLSGKKITAKAKKLSISKGELFLAARIKQLQSQVR